MKRIALGIVGFLLVVGALVVAPVSASAQSDYVTVSVSPSSVTPNGALAISGNVYAASGSVDGTAVVITVKNPSGQTVTTLETSVQGGHSPSGTYYTHLTTGGTSAWVNGYYNVTATYSTSLSGSPVTATATFLYGVNAVSTNTLTITTAPTETTVGGYSGAQLVYTNTYAQPLSALVWLVAKNSLGQTIGIFVGSATMNSQQSVTVFIPTINLAAGSYSVSIFATTPSFVAISQVSTMSLQAGSGSSGSGSDGGNTTPSQQPQISASSVNFPASDFVTSGGNTNMTCTTTQPSGLPYIELTNAGNASAALTRMTIIWGGSYENYTPATSTACTVGASGSSASTVYLELSSSAAIDAAAVTGQVFKGYITLSSGGSLTFSGTWQ